MTDPLASGREVILFHNAGVGRSTGDVPGTIAGMAGHAMAFLDELGLKTFDAIGYSLGGMVTLQMVQDRASIFRRMILVGTAPRGGEDIMHVEKPSLAKRCEGKLSRRSKDCPVRTYAGPTRVHGSWKGSARVSRPRSAMPGKASVLQR